jgi:protein TonB
MWIPPGNLLRSTSSIKTAGWGTSIAVHVAGAVFGMLHAVSAPIEQPELLGSSSQLELAVRWEETEDPAPPIEITPIDPPELPSTETPSECFATIEPYEPDHKAMRNCECQPSVEVETIAEAVPLAAQTAPKQHLAARREEPLQAAASHPIPSRSAAVSRPVVKALRAALAPPMPATPPSPQPSAASTGATAVDQLPKKLPTNPAPVYPADAFASRQEGWVLLNVQVNERGLVDDVSVATSSGVPSLDEAAMRTVRNWRFEPARRGNTPVAAAVTVPIRFSIERRGSRL